MTRINMNKVAKEVSIEESGKEEISIAQIKEVLKVYNTILINNYEESEILSLHERYAK